MAHLPDPVDPKRRLLRFSVSMDLHRVNHELCRLASPEPIAGLDAAARERKRQMLTAWREDLLALLLKLSRDERPSEGPPPMTGASA